MKKGSDHSPLHLEELININEQNTPFMSDNPIIILPDR